MLHSYSFKSSIELLDYDSQKWLKRKENTFGGLHNMRMYLSSSEMMCDHLHGPPINWDQ